MPWGIFFVRIWRDHSVHRDLPLSHSNQPTETETSCCSTNPDIRCQSQPIISEVIGRQSVATTNKEWASIQLNRALANEHQRVWNVTHSEDSCLLNGRLRGCWGRELAQNSFRRSDWPRFSSPGGERARVNRSAQREGKGRESRRRGMFRGVETDLKIHQYTFSQN